MIQAIAVPTQHKTAMKVDIIVSAHLRRRLNDKLVFIALGDTRLGKALWRR